MHKAACCSGTPANTASKYREHESASVDKTERFINAETHPRQFVLGLGAGVHESLSDDGQRRVHHLRHVDVEDEVRVLQDVHPEP